MVRIVRFQPKGNRLASSDKSGDIRVWDRSGKLVTRLEGHRNLVRTLSFHPSGKLLASGSKDGTMKLWDMEGLKLLGTVTHAELPFQVLEFAPDGKTLATGSTDGKVLLWDVAKLLPAPVRK